MAFSVGVEMLNLRVRRARRPVRLHKGMESDGAGGNAPPL
jgi:hypothetical protein